MKKSSLSPYILWSLVVFFMAFQFVIRLSTGVLKESLMERFSMDISSFGLLAGYYYLGYAGAQIPIGLFFEKYSFKKVLISSILCLIIGDFIFIFANKIEYLYFARILIGAGSAAAFLSIVKVTRYFFSDENYPMLIGISITIGLLGAMFGTTPMSMIFEHFGYGNSFMILNFILFILIIITLIFGGAIDNNPIENKSILNGKQEEQNIIKQLLDVISIRLIVVSIAGGFMVGTLEGFADAWGIYYLQDVMNFNKNQSTSTMSLIYLGMCFGSPVLVAFAGYIKSEKLAIFLSGIITSLIFFVIFYLEINYNILLILIFILGILCSYQALVFSFVTKIVHKNQATIAVAVVNCINMSFGYFFHGIIGEAMSGYDLSVLDNVADVKNIYVNALMVIPVASILGGLPFLYFMWRKDN